MSMFEVIPADPYVISNRLAESILIALGLDSSEQAQNRLIDRVPEFKAIDNLVTAAECVWNDGLLAQKDITEMEGDSLQASMDILHEAFIDLTGEEPREYAIVLDEGAGGDDDEFDEEEE